MDHGIEGELKIREGLCELAKRKGIGLVATNDVHYIDRSDAAAHDALLCIQTGKTLDDEKRMRLTAISSTSNPRGDERAFCRSPRSDFEYR